MLTIEHLRAMAHSPVRNYAIPGLTSWLVGQPSQKGCVRMFECERTHEEAIVPHSHRFDFECFVVQGQVRNVIWEVHGNQGDEYALRRLDYSGNPGAYGDVDSGHVVDNYVKKETVYGAGTRYGMKHDEIHSIFFERGTVVLFFEGPSLYDFSHFLEPYCNHKIVPTFEVRPWMFEKGE